MLLPLALILALIAVVGGNGFSLPPFTSHFFLSCNFLLIWLQTSFFLAVCVLGIKFFARLLFEAFESLLLRTFEKSRFCVSRKCRARSMLLLKLVLIVFSTLSSMIFLVQSI